nr:MAG TPA: hypothetical protein [Caudoviricetes sp.]
MIINHTIKPSRSELKTLKSNPKSNPKLTF